jgi:hypothetical protein
MIKAPAGWAGTVMGRASHVRFVRGALSDRGDSPQLPCGTKPGNQRFNGRRSLECY